MTGPNDIKVLIQYTDDKGEIRNLKAFRSFLSEKFNEVADILQKFDVKTDKLLPVAGCITATVPKENLNALQDALQDKGFKVIKNEPKYTI